MAESPSRSPILDDQPAVVDCLDFGSYTEALCKLIIHPSTRTPLTLGIYGRWGTGKTTLMHMLEKELKAAGLATVWFNAWQYGKENELWAAFLQSILNKVRSDLRHFRRLAFNLRLLSRRVKWESVPGFLGQFLFRVAVVAAPVLVTWPFAQQFQQEAYDTLIRIGGGVAAALLGGWVMIKPMAEAIRKNVTIDFSALRQVSDYEKHIAFLDTFREHFTDVVWSLQRQGDKQLAVFIDDLDRCAPESALQILDAIKLFVDIPGCVYILGLDLEVVKKAIETKYKGDAVAQRQYLSKIIQLPFLLPPLAPDEMKAFVERIAVDLPDSRCREVFVDGLSANPREIKRTLNIFSLLWNLSNTRHELTDVIKPVRLAKVVAIQHGYPDLHSVLQDRPHLLIELETYFRRVTREPPHPEAEGAQPPLPVAPLLQPFIQNEGLRRMLVLHEPGSGHDSDANFADLKPDDVRVYFTLTVRTETPVAGATERVGATLPPKVGPGDVLNDRYEIGGILGSGGMSTVYQAYDRNARHKVAVKVLEPLLASNSHVRGLFEQESRLLRQLEHPNLVRAYDAGGTERGLSYYVMEILSGGDLRTLIETGPLSLAETIRIALPVLDCLDYLHRSQIVHRDIKPGSILFNERGVPKLTDFGVAMVLSERRSRTAVTRTAVTITGPIVGTVSYMAPEQVRGATDQRSDLFAFGILLFECLTGRQPFSADTQFEVLRRILQEPLPMPRTLNPAISLEVEAVIIKLTAKEPGERYQTAREVKEALIQASGILPGEESPISLRLARKVEKESGDSLRRGLELRQGDRTSRALTTERDIPKD